jgi:hypothetical protein
MNGQLIIPDDNPLSDALIDKLEHDAERIIFISYQRMDADMKSGERPFVSRTFYAHHTEVVTLVFRQNQTIKMLREEVRRLRAGPVTVNNQINVLLAHPAENAAGQTAPQSMVGQGGVLSDVSTRLSTSVSAEQTAPTAPKRQARGYKRDNAAVKKAFKWLSRNPSAIDDPVRHLAVRIKIGKDSVLKARKFIKDGVTDIEAALSDNVK